jgi:hypothetical protein
MSTPDDSPEGSSEVLEHPDVIAARARAGERRRQIVAGQEERRRIAQDAAKARASSLVTEVPGVDDAYLQADPFPAALIVAVEEPPGPPFDPNLEETLANNPGLAAMIQASNPGVKIPGLSAPPRPTPGGVSSNRAHYRDGMRDVGLMQPVDPAFRQGGIFAPTPGAYVGGLGGGLGGSLGGGMTGMGSAPPPEGTAFRSLEVQRLVDAMESLSAPAASIFAHPSALSSPHAVGAGGEVAHLVRSMHDAVKERSKETEGLVLLSPQVVLRELLALAHLGVSQTRAVGGLIFQRLDVVTFAVFAPVKAEVAESPQERLRRSIAAAKTETPVDPGSFSSFLDEESEVGEERASP